MSVLKRLTVLQNEAQLTPVPTRKYFHIGQPEVMQDVGECVPMISWVDDNLSRYVVSDAANTSWGRDRNVLIRALPNVDVKNGEGVFVITGCGDDESVPHPVTAGAKMHFVHLNLAEDLFDDEITKLYVYKLDGVQVKALSKKKVAPEEG
ncbi:MAG TPA: hypothetical protein ENK57_08005 [Polyangiaceae bacterium]|nr:hypothetical protein [Polyangiaceae bacterium]